jgi:hypothetical protein
MNLPSNFSADLQELRELIAAAQEALQLGESEDVARAKRLTEWATVFVNKWASQIGDPAISSAVRRANLMAKVSRNHLDEIFLANEAKVLEARGNLIVAEGLAGQDVRFGQMTDALAFPRESLDYCDLDPAANVRESKALCVLCKEEFARALRVFQSNWPEKCTPALIQTFEEINLEGIHGRMQQLTEEMRRLKLRSMALFEPS